MLPCRDDAGVVELADVADEAAAANQDLALAAGVAGEGVVHQVHDALGREVGRGLEVEVLAGLVPDAAGEIDVLLLVVVPELARHAEEVGLLHAQAHVIDGGLLLVAHRPAHLLVGQALQRGLLDLHLEDLAQVAALLGQRLELRRLHVEFAGGASHAHQGGVAADVGDAAGHPVDGAAVDRHHAHAVAVAAHDIQDQVLARLVQSLAVIARRVLHQDGVGGVKDVVVGSGEIGHRRFIALADLGRADILHELGRRGLGVHAVVVYGHAAAVLAARVARNLVDGRGHGADFDNLLVDLVEQQVGRAFVGQFGRQGTVNDVLPALGTGDDHPDDGHRGRAALAAAQARGENSDENHSDGKDH